MRRMLILAGLLGLAAGVLINTLADVLPPDAEGRPRPWRGPHCLACGRERPAADWLALAAGFRGGCRFCGAPRGARPAGVELLAAAGSAYLWVWAEGDLARFLAAVLVAGLFLLISVIDLEHRLILWRVVWVGGLALLVTGGLLPDRGWQKTLLGGLAGYGMVAVLFLLGQVYAWVVARWRGQPLEEVAFGGGDVNLAGLIGLAVGWSGVVIALFLGVLAAGVFSLGVLVVQLARGRYDPHMPFPYGPFLVLGGLAVYLYGRDVAAWWLAR